MERITKSGFTILIGIFGGIVFSRVTGLSFGWLLGSIFFVGSYQIMISNRLLALVFPKWLKNLGQLLIGINIGQQFNIQIVNLFLQKWPIIIFINFLTFVISFIFGLLVWCINMRKDLVTSLLSTSPGGISFIPSISEEMGGDVITVSVLHTLRLLIVISLIPLLALIVNDPNSATMYNQDIHPKNLPVGASIVILLLIGVIGSKIWSYFNLPVPYLTGAMVSVGLFNFFIDDNVYHLDTSLTSLQWPIIIAQILIGISIGFNIDNNFLHKLRDGFNLKGLAIVGLIFSLIVSALIFSIIFSIPLSTMLLAFSPGGAAEIMIIASSLNVDVPFVVTVQTLRLISSVFILPFLINFVRSKEKSEVLF